MRIAIALSTLRTWQAASPVWEGQGVWQSPVQVLGLFGFPIVCAFLPLATNGGVVVAQPINLDGKLFLGRGLIITVSKSNGGHC